MALPTDQHHAALTKEMTMILKWSAGWLNKLVNNLDPAYEPQRKEVLMALTQLGTNIQAASARIQSGEALITALQNQVEAKDQEIASLNAKYATDVAALQAKVTASESPEDVAANAALQAILATPAPVDSTAAEVTV